MFDEKNQMGLHIDITVAKWVWQSAKQIRLKETEIQETS